MVDITRPALKPQAYAKKDGTAIPVVEAAVPNITNVPSVTQFAASSMADTYINMADDARRLEAMRNDQYNFSTEVLNAAVKDIKQAQSLEAEKEFNRILLESEARIDQVRSTSGVDSVARDSLAAYDDVRTNVLNEANLSSYQRDYLSSKLEQTRTNVASSAANYQRELRRQEQQDTLSEMLRTREFIVSKYPDQIGSVVDEIDVTVEELGANLTPRERKLFADEAKKSLRTTALMSRIKTNPSGVRSELNSGKWNDYFTVAEIETLKADADSVAKSMQAQANKVMTEKQKQLDGLLNVQIAGADGVDLPTQTELDKLRDNNQISFDDWVARSKQLISRRDAIEKETADLRDGIDIISRGDIVTPGDTDSVRAFNEGYKFIKSTLDQMPVDQRVEQNLGIVQNSRYVPNLLKGEIQEAASSGDPEKVKFAVEMVRKLNSNPNTQYLAEDVLDGRSRQRIEYINERLIAGTKTFDEAVTQADQKLAALGRPNVEARNKELAQLRKEIDFRTQSRKAFSSIFDILPGTQLRTDGLAAKQLDRAEVVYRLEFEDRYSQLQDKKLAMKMAEEAVLSGFTREGINGVDEIMEYGVSNYYDIPGLSKADNLKWQRGQMLDAAKELTKNMALDPAIVKNFEDRVRIAPNPLLTPGSVGANSTIYDIYLVGETDPIRLTRNTNMFKFDAGEQKSKLIEKASKKKQRQAELQMQLNEAISTKGPASLAVNKIRTQMRKEGMK